MMNKMIKPGQQATRDVSAEIDAVHRPAWDQAYGGHKPDAETLQRLDRYMAESAEVDRLAIQAARVPAHAMNIGGYLTELMQAYPNVGKDDREGFGGLLLDDVMAAKPSIGALDAGCKKVRRTIKFLPSIAEVLEALGTAEVNLRVAASRLDSLAEMRAELAKALAARGKGPPAT